MSSTLIIISFFIYKRKYLTYPKKGNIVYAFISFFLMHFFFSFQYILTAPTSIATKKGEPSLTYINQGQSYELKLKKLGDLSNHYKKKWLRSSIRICFHERRLQYIESEQIAEWSRTHPNERILEVRSLGSLGS